jgi:hypothetical protein
LTYALHEDIESDFSEKNFGNVLFWAKIWYYFLLILEKTPGVVTLWRQELVENADIVPPLSQPFHGGPTNA